jgi:hypothetical protein
MLIIMQAALQEAADWAIAYIERRADQARDIYGQYSFSPLDAALLAAFRRQADDLARRWRQQLHRGRVPCSLVHMLLDMTFAMGVEALRLGYSKVPHLARAALDSLQDAIADRMRDAEPALLEAHQVQDLVNVFRQRERDAWDALDQRFSTMLLPPPSVGGLMPQLQQGGAMQQQRYGMGRGRPMVEPAVPPCWDFQRGHCGRGASCRFSHALPPQAVLPWQQQQQQQQQQQHQQQYAAAAPAWQQPPPPPPQPVFWQQPPPPPPPPQQQPSQAR